MSLATNFADDPLTYLALLHLFISVLLSVK